MHEIQYILHLFVSINSNIHEIRKNMWVVKFISKGLFISSFVVSIKIKEHNDLF